jgi:hypothetical protein
VEQAKGPTLRNQNKADVIHSKAKKKKRIHSRETGNTSRHGI